MKQDLSEYLKGKTYPGRGILLGKSPDGSCGIIAYFIMGRSLNSRNRVFEETDDGIRTRAFDESKMEDPSLIIYNPVRRLADGKTIVSNGDQTDTLRTAFQVGWSFQDALRARTFEPDGPNWTSRITGMLDPNGSYMLSIIKTLDADPACCCRFFFEYESPLPGTGHFLSTYTEDGEPLPAYDGEPLYVSVTSTGPQQMADAIWKSLDKDNRVSLYVSWTNLETRETESVIINANEGEAQ